ncbi:MAG: ABC transporter substrate-binding protein [Ferrimonas sp.]
MASTNFLATALLGLAGFCAFSVQATESPRIISAGSTVTEMLSALGAEKYLVAIDLTSKAVIEDTQLPMVGYHRQLATEGLLSLSPTHLLGSDEMGPENTLHLLRSAGVQVEVFPASDSLSDFDARIDALAALTHTQTKAEQIKATVQQQITEISENLPARAPRVMFMMVQEGRPISVAGAETTVDTIIHMVGGVNPVAAHSTSFKQLSSEAIVEMQPEVILLAERTYNALGGAAGLVQQQPLLGLTPALQQQQVIAIPSAAIQGGFGLASLSLAEKLHQQLLAIAAE